MASRTEKKTTLSGGSARIPSGRTTNPDVCRMQPRYLAPTLEAQFIIRKCTAHTVTQT